jgi:hypothetical protein
MEHQELNRLQGRSNRSPRVVTDTGRVAGFVFPGGFPMPSAPFLVLNRRVIHQAKTLPEAKGFCEGHPQPTSIAMLAETRGKCEMDFVLQIVDDAGKVLATSAPIYFGDVVDAFLDARILLVPASMAMKAVAP